MTLIVTYPVMVLDALQQNDGCVLNATEQASLPMKRGPKSFVKHSMQQYSSKEILNAAQAADQSHDLQSFLAIVHFRQSLGLDIKDQFLQGAGGPGMHT